LYKLGDKNLLCLEGNPIEIEYPSYEFILDENGDKTIDKKTALYQIDTKSNLNYRALIYSKCLSSKEYQRTVIEMCKRNILFYFNVFCWTYRLDLPPNQNPYVPFTTFPKQDEIITWFLWCYANGETGIVEKTRGCGLSWIWVVTAEWVAKFHKGRSISMMSQNEEDVDMRGNPDSLFEKIRINLRIQPEWMRMGYMENSQYDKIGLISFPETGSTISGAIAKGTAQRGGRASMTGLDEFAHIKEDSAILTSASELTNCTIIFSTPKGENNEFARMANTPGVNKIAFHWRDHPLRNIHWEKKKRDDPKITEETFAQEYEISYTKSNIGRIFPDFKSHSEDADPDEWVHVADVNDKYYDYDPNYDVYTCSDLGRDMSYFGFFQIKPAHPKYNPYTEKTSVFFDERYWVRGNIISVRKELNEFASDYKMVFREHISDVRTANAKDAVEMGWGEYLKADQAEVMRMFNVDPGPPIHVVGQRYSEKMPIDNMALCLRTKGKIIFHPRCRLGIKALSNWSYEIDQFNKDHEGRSKIKVKPNGQAVVSHGPDSHPGKALIYGMQHVYGGENNRIKTNKSKISWDFKRTTVRGL